MRPLVIVRPEPGASRTAEQARRLGLEPWVMPLFELVALDWSAPEPGRFDALVITSANAIRLGGGQLDTLGHLPVHAIGEASAAAAREAGFAIASVGDGGAEAMDLPRDQRLLHLAGRHHRPVAATLSVPVYEARPIAGADDLAGLAGSVVAVHSPRAGCRLAELVVERSSIAIAAISSNSAAACGGGWEAVAAADRPSDAALLALAARLCETPPR
jgi:uroporphyrinogen-III synthase